MVIRINLFINHNAAGNGANISRFFYGFGFMLCWVKMKFFLVHNL